VDKKIASCRAPGGITPPRHHSTHKSILYSLPEKP
jgi:hypothetical protein